MSKQLRWHIGLWVAYFLLVYYQDLLSETWTFPVAIYNLSSFGLIVVSFYLFYLWIAPQFLKPGKYIYIFFSLFALIAVNYLLQEMLNPWIFGSDNYFQTGFLEDLDSNLFLSFVPAAAGTLLFMFEQRQINQANALKLQNERNESELAFLRSQINPHFLFNTMSFLHTRAFKLDEKLANSILRLSDVMRYTLKNSKSATITVQEEITLVKDLIDIYKDRFGEKCFVNLNIAGSDFEQKFEPLILMPFIENAFKHGVYSNAAFPIDFNLNVSKGKLTFSVRNKTKHQIKDEVSGIGISNLKRRLELMYPNNYQLDIDDNGETYHAVLKINL